MLPGTYKVVMSFGSQKDSTTINVKFDPRLAISEETLLANYEANKQLENEIGIASQAMDQLRNSNKILDDILKQAKVKGESYDSLRNLTNATKDSIKMLVDELIGAKSDKQGITGEENPSIIDYFYSAVFYLGSFNLPGPTQARTMTHAKNKLLPWLAKTNEFYEKQWKEYQKFVEEAKLSPFEEVKSFQLND